MGLGTLLLSPRLWGVREVWRSVKETSSHSQKSSTPGHETGQLVFEIEAVTKTHESNDIRNASPVSEPFISVDIIRRENTHTDTKRIEEGNTSENGGRHTGSVSA